MTYNYSLQALLKLQVYNKSCCLTCFPNNFLSGDLMVCYNHTQIHRHRHMQNTGTYTNTITDRETHRDTLTHTGIGTLYLNSRKWDQRGVCGVKLSTHSAANKHFLVGQ